ncbi:MAG: hypothetical protein QM775_05185 [Pirellulales bacterium]
MSATPTQAQGRGRQSNPYVKTPFGLIPKSVYNQGFVNNPQKLEQYRQREAQMQKQLQGQAQKSRDQRQDLARHDATRNDAARLQQRPAELRSDHAVQADDEEEIAADLKRGDFKRKTSTKSKRACDSNESHARCCFAESRSTRVHSRDRDSIIA